MTLDRGRWLRHLAALLLGIHLLTPQNWPFAHGDAIPWDLTPLIPKCHRRRPLFSRSAAIRIGESSLSVACVVRHSGLCRGAHGMGLEPGLGPVDSTSAPAIFRACGVLAFPLARIPGRLVWSDGPTDRVLSRFSRFFHRLAQSRRSVRTGRVAGSLRGNQLPYYLLGNGLRNDVRYVNIDRHRDWLLHDYHREARGRGQGNWPDSRPGWDRIRPDFQAWVDNLDAEGIQLLVVTRANPVEGIHNIADSESFPIERRWADSHPERFEPLYGAAERDPWFRLYRLSAVEIGSATPHGFIRGGSLASRRIRARAPAVGRGRRTGSPAMGDARALG